MNALRWSTLLLLSLPAATEALDLDHAVSSDFKTSNVRDVILDHPSDETVSRPLLSRLRDLPVFPEDYWKGPPSQYCDGSTDVQSAYQAAADVARKTGRPLHIGGPSDCVLGSTIAVSGRLSMLGDGPAHSVLTATFNGPIFTWTSSVNEVASSLVTGFTLRGQFSPTAEYKASRGFLIQGDSSSFFQYNRFRALSFEGLYAAFEITKRSVTTRYGQESTAAWLVFDDISVRGGSRPAVYGWIWDTGSGTGITYSNLKTGMSGPDGAVLYYPNNVVGDIVVTGGHFGGAAGSKLIKVDTVTNYRNNILVSNSQIDAGMDVPFDFAPSLPSFARITFAANNVGGNVTLNTPPIENGILDDQLVDARRAGKTFETTTKGPQSVGLFAVTLDSLDPYTGAECTVNASGVVGGLAGGITRAVFLLGRNGGDPVVTLAGAPTSTVAFPQFFALSASPVAGTGRVTISTSFTSANGKSKVNAQIRCTGGVYSVLRL